MSKTASYVKDRYNSKTYDRYTFYIRKDEPLNDALQERKKMQSTSQIAKDALLMFFDEKIKPNENARHRKGARPTPNYSTKRRRRTAMTAIIEQLEQIKAAEEISRDNYPENLQSSPAFGAAEECIARLEEAIETLGSTY